MIPYKDMIKFNEVTWYSKLAAVIFFIGILPVLTFYIGTQYQRVHMMSDFTTNLSSKADTALLQGARADKTKLQGFDEEYSQYLETGSVPVGWILEELKSENKTITYIIPIEYQYEIYASLTNRAIDSWPEGWSREILFDTVLGLKEFTIGDRKVSRYSFVSPLSYNFDMYEVEIDASSHVEFSNSGKGVDKVAIPLDIWDKIAGSIKVM